MGMIQPIKNKLGQGSHILRLKRQDVNKIVRSRAYGEKIMIYRFVALNLLVLFVSQCSPIRLFDCAEENISEARSPNGKIVVRVMERNCGATTDFSTIVRIGFEDASPEETDEIYVVKGTQLLKTVWVNESLLELHCIGCKQKDIFTQVEQWENVIIYYAY